MTAADIPLLDLPAFLRTLRSERTTAMLIHGAPLCGKTRFARRLVDKLDGGYLDVLEAISNRPDLSASIDKFDSAALRRLAVEFAESNPKDIIIIDEFDFLFPIWGGELTPFKDMLYNLYNPQHTAFVFFAHTRPEWEAWRLESSILQSRIVPFENLKPL
jgi:hypothetical protein